MHEHIHTQMGATWTRSVYSCMTRPAWQRPAPVVGAWPTAPPSPRPWPPVKSECNSVSACTNATMCLHTFVCALAWSYMVTCSDIHVCAHVYCIACMCKSEHPCARWQCGTVLVRHSGPEQIWVNISRNQNAWRTHVRVYAHLHRCAHTYVYIIRMSICMKGDFHKWVCWRPG